MTLIVFILSITFSVWHYNIIGREIEFLNGMSVYHFTIYSTFASACLWMLISAMRGKEIYLVGFVCIAANLFIGNKYIWGFEETEIIRAIWCLSLMLVIYLFDNLLLKSEGFSTSSMIIMLLYGCNIFASCASYYGLFSDRPKVFTGFYYADFLAYTAHLQAIVLGATHGDFGSGIRDFLNRIVLGNYDRRRIAISYMRRRIFN